MVTTLPLSSPTVEGGYSPSVPDSAPARGLSSVRTTTTGLTRSSPTGPHMATSRPNSSSTAQGPSPTTPKPRRSTVRPWPSARQARGWRQHPAGPAQALRAGVRARVPPRRARAPRRRRRNRSKPFAALAGGHRRRASRRDRLPARARRCRTSIRRGPGSSRLTGFEDLESEHFHAPGARTTSMPSRASSCSRRRRP